MIKRLISFFLTLFLLVGVSLEARYKYNPYTKKLDYYVAAEDIDLGDIGDITLTGLATGNILYYDGAAWVNLATGANAEVLTLAAGIPSWAAGGAPAAHAASHEVAGADLVDHDQLTGYLAAQHLTLPNTIVAVLTDHTQAAHNALLIDADTVDGEHAAAIVTNARVKAHFPDTIANILSDHNLLAHTALGLFDQSSDVDHNLTTNYFIYDHVGEDHVVDHNIWIGWLAGQDLAVGGQYNTLIGEEAGADVTTGDWNIIIGYMAGRKLTANSGNIFIGRNIASVAASLAHSNVIIGDIAAIELTNGYENIIIGKEAGRDLKSAGLNVIIGWQASLEHESGNYNTIIGTQAGYGVAGLSNYSHNTFIGFQAGELARTAAVRNVIIGHEAAEDLSTGTNNIVIGYMAGEGWLDTESEKLVIDVTDTTTPLIYGDFSADNITINGDFNVTMDAALDQIVFAQSAVAGIEDQALIFIDDDRTGVTVNEPGEASLHIQTAAQAALFIDGGTYGIVLEGNAQFRTQSGVLLFNNAYTGYHVGTIQKWLLSVDSNASQDTILTLRYENAYATDTSAIFISKENPFGMTDHDDYESPTFVLTNSEGADANDYAGVVIGERAQANVKIAHYFDFYAMTGSADGSIDVGDEVAAIFRFGASGSAVPGYAIIPGDVLFEGSIEIDGNQHTAGYLRSDYTLWVDCFDHGSTVAKYGQDWDLTALNTQGTGSNTIQTNPGNITMTTDNNAVGDNEGTRTDYQMVDRHSQARTDFGIHLSQTANTKFYCGWNTSGTNAMVAAADEYVIIFFDVSDNANWQIKVGDGATEDVFTSGIAGAVGFVRHEIWVESDGTVHWVVNGTELDITGSVDNLMTASDHYLIVGQVQSVTGAAILVAEIGYVEHEKLKDH